MTKPTTTTVTEVQITKVHPDPQNRNVSVDTELKKSIAQVGVKTPLLIRVHPSKPGHYEIVARERRWKASNAAKLTTVPCMLFDGSESERILTQALENFNRQDLTPFEEGEIFVRAIEADLTIKDLAAKLGISAAVVKRRMALLDLPPQARHKVLTGEWSPTDAAAVLAHIGNEPLMAWALKQRFNPSGHYSLPNAIAREAHTRETKTRLAQRTKALKAEGITIVKNPYGPNGSQTLTQLGLDAAEHATEPCHAIRIHMDYKNDIHETPICTEPQRHQPDSESGSQLLAKARNSGPAPRELTADEIAANAEREKQQARREKATAKRDATILEMTGAAATDMIATSFVVDAMVYDAIPDPTDTSKATQALRLRNQPPVGDRRPTHIRGLETHPIRQDQDPRSPGPPRCQRTTASSRRGARQSNGTDQSEHTEPAEAA